MKLARRALLLLVLTLVLAAPRRARADAMPPGEIVATFGAILLAGVVVDTMFTVHDAVVASDKREPDKGWSVAEAIVATPQSLILNFGAAASVRDPVYGLQMFLLVTGAWTSSLAAHGYFAATKADNDPGALYGASWAIGADSTLTLMDLSAATNGHLASRAVGVMAAMFTLPQVIVGSYEASRPTQNRAPWIALTAWSGALLLHGVASGVWGSHGEDAPPLEPERPPPRPPDSGPTLKKAAQLEKPWFRLTPAMVTDGLDRGFGFAAVGRF